MKTPTPRRLLQFVTRRLRLGGFLRHPGDGRPQPQIPARALMWSLLLGHWLREASFHGLEQLVRYRARTLGVGQRFGDDALGYFTERLDPAVTRAALIDILHRAKRNKAFQKSPFVGLAIDGTAAGRSRVQACALCRPRYNVVHRLLGYSHQLATITIVGTDLPLPFDAEPYGPGDSEYAAGQRLLARAIAHLGVRFADYVVVDGLYASAPFLHAVQRAGLHVVARVKNNLQELGRSLEKRFGSQPPTHVYYENEQRIEIWDADDFDPWEKLRWPTVRVIRYRQHRADGSVVQADWLTDFPSRKVSSLALYHMAKSRWEIENQGFNDAKNRYGLEHISHHHANSVLVSWLLTFLAMVIERLYRIRYLHRGKHSVTSAEQLCRLLWISLSQPHSADTG